jgi:DNA-3-methyladenine glycosylase I
MFEMLSLEGAQAGLSWETVLRKMDSYREAFDGWDVDAIAAYDEDKVAELLQNEGIVRNRLKVRSVIRNARLVVKMRDDVPFSDFCWSFVNGQPLVTRYARLKDVPLIAPGAEELSKALKKRGFNFVGPTIVTSFMQACGLVNDHTLACHRHPDRLAEAAKAAAAAGDGGDDDGAPSAKRPRQ